MVGISLGVLLYDHSIDQRVCSATYLDKKYGLKLSRSFEKRVGDVLLESYLKIMDMSDSLTGVYKLRRGTQFDMATCQ